MPRRALRPCSTPGCPHLVRSGSRCAVHTQQDRRGGEVARPSPSARGYGRKWQKVRDAYLQEHPYCVVCGAIATDVDHIVPRRRGGTDDWSNLQSMCHSHHSQKTAKVDGGYGGRG